MVYVPSPIRPHPASGGPPGYGSTRPLAVVAVGGNALTSEDQSGTHDEILANAADMADSLAELYRGGWRIAVVHGNGPQVGNLAIQQDAGADEVPPQPLHQLCAMTQGQRSAFDIDR